jgi:hypothetical protein
LLTFVINIMYKIGDIVKIVNPQPGGAALFKNDIGKIIDKHDFVDRSFGRLWRIKLKDGFEFNFFETEIKLVESILPKQYGIVEWCNKYY